MKTLTTDNSLYSIKNLASNIQNKFTELNVFN